MFWIRPHLTFANVVSVLALLWHWAALPLPPLSSLGGTSRTTR